MPPPARSTVHGGEAAGESSGLGFERWEQGRRKNASLRRVGVFSFGAHNRGAAGQGLVPPARAPGPREPGTGVKQVAEIGEGEADGHGGQSDCYLSASSWSTTLQAGYRRDLLWTIRTALGRPPGLVLGRREVPSFQSKGARQSARPRATPRSAVASSTSL